MTSRCRVARTLAGVAAAFAICSCHVGRESPPIMSWAEYRSRARDVEWPYVIRLQRPPGELLYFGARHTNQTGDAQVERIERLWACFKPTLALNEGEHPRVERTRDEAVQKHGEAGLVRFLAARDDVPAWTLDPSLSEEVAHLRRVFAATDVKLFFVLRAVAQFVARSGGDGLDSEINRRLRIFHDTPGLGVSPRSVAELASLYEERFPGRGTYSDAPLAWFNPTRNETILNQVSRESNEYRDRMIVAMLRRHVVDGQRVFAVVGGSHVVMQEAALKAVTRVRVSKVSPANECQPVATTTASSERRPLPR